jgi:Protein of unknown function (DUF2852)
MHSYSNAARSGGISAFFRRAEDWLDQRGKWAWIAAMVLGFVFFWPAGLALLAYMIWGKQMFSRSCGKHRTHTRDRGSYSYSYSYGPTSGNTAFDSYKAEALRRLEEEQDAFEAFLQRLRNSKDKTQFDAFMEERARATQAADAAAAETTTTETKPTDGSRPGEY